MSQLDQIVKGAPPPEAEAKLAHTVSKTPSPPIPSVEPDQGVSATAAPDPLSTLPSSPPQIYLNLLILESSLRSQYLALRARRRQNTFFLLLLGLWIAYFAYALFLRPREDGRGVGGSVYWVVEMGEKVALMGGIVTGILIWGTGQWERGVRWPRRWLAVANRGLRGMNAKIVVIRGPWWKELLSYLAFIFPYSAFFSSSTSFHYVEHTEGREKDKRASVLGRSAYDEDTEAGIEEDIAPGGDYIKLLLLPKSFSPAFRENWDEYRSEYWERENERRAELRRKVREREYQRAKLEGGWLWWTGWRGWKRKTSPTHKTSDPEKSHHHHHNHHLRSAAEGGRSRRQRSPSVADAHTHSRTSSRSTTPNPLSDADDRLTPDRDRPRARRGSAASTNSERKKKTRGGSGSRRTPSPLTMTEMDSEPSTKKSTPEREEAK